MAREVEAIEAAGRELASRAFVLEGAGRRDAGLKIARGVYVYEGRLREGLADEVRVSVRLRDGVVDALAVRGRGVRGLAAAARRLVGKPLPRGPACAEGANPAEALGMLLARGSIAQVKRLRDGAIDDLVLAGPVGSVEGGNGMEELRARSAS